MKKLDNLWSKAVRARANSMCERCGQEGQSAHHIFGRARKSTRWDLNNGIYLCNGCHTGNDLSAHKSPHKFREWLDMYKGVDNMQELEFKSNQIFKGDLDEVKQILINNK